MSGMVRVTVDGESREAAVRGVERRPAASGPYDSVHIETSRGRVDCHYYAASGAKKGVIMVGGVGGGFDTPACGLYPRLCEDLQRLGISALRVRYRYATNLAEAVLDTVIAIRFLKGEGALSIGLIGHSLGGAVVATAAANDEAVDTVVTLSTQSYGIAPVSRLKPSTSVLVIHGEKDAILPPASSVYAHQLAHEPKRLILYEGAGHMLDEAADAVYREVKDWLVENLG
ncbi:hypothetical protein ABH15_07775 [Methanoculleus taiwanensis]|uniref:Alpha/beta hydrolase fold-5 domain-containing protein n=1 Tax=Methanoculleus taiwanensis TaxID=1550565 RepID=A0A498H2B2_9EURY|nr:alpha/beta hydrolase [Methanoculleus taiwanensis]RXE56076.1 hypothetical protein ABH15_07775 [Methanoculleus taiwanensis]